MTTIQLEPADVDAHGSLEWPLECCKESGTLRNIIEDLGDVGGAVPLTEINHGPLACIGTLVQRYQASVNSDSTSKQYFEALRRRWEERQQPNSAELLEVGRPPARPQWLEDMLAGIDRMGPMALFEVLLGANFLDMPMVVLAVSHFVADKVSAINNTPGLELEAKLTHLRELFQVENDFGLEEYERIKQEHAWCLAAPDPDAGPGALPDAAATESM